MLDDPQVLSVIEYRRDAAGDTMRRFHPSTLLGGLDDSGQRGALDLIDGYVADRRVCEPLQRGLDLDLVLVIRERRELCGEPLPSHGPKRRRGRDRKSTRLNSSH